MSRRGHDVQLVHIDLIGNSHEKVYGIPDRVETLDDLGGDPTRGALRLIAGPLVESRLGLYNAHVGSISFLAKALRRDDLWFLYDLDLSIGRPVPGYIDALGPALDALEGLWKSMIRDEGGELSGGRS